MFSLTSCFTFGKTQCAGCTIAQPYRDPQALALVKAAVRGDADEVERLVRAGANPNHQEEGSVPMLIWALCAHNKKGFEALLKAGADPNLGGTGKGFAGYGVVGAAFTRNSRSFIRQGWSATVMAAAIEDPYYLRLALQYGGDPDAKRGGPEDRPLVLSARFGFIENVRILLDAGANVNIHDEKFTLYDALNRAIMVYNRWDIVLLLLERGYNHDLKTILLHRDDPISDDMRPYRDKVFQMLKERGIE
jgi:hypothetical protein